MSQQSNDSSRWIHTSSGAFYWRHATKSYWKGPPDERVWVPSMDSPPDMPPPPDFGDGTSGPANTAPPPQPAPVTQFGTIPALQNAAAGPPAYQQNAPHTEMGFAHPSPFGRPPRLPNTQTYRGTGSNYVSPFAGYVRRDANPEGDRGTNPADAPLLPRGPSAPQGNPTCSPAREAQRSQTQEFQERARDQQLRARALSTCPSTPPAHASSPPSVNRPLPPRVDDAPRDERGHPILPIVPGGMEDEKVLKENRLKEKSRYAEAICRNRAGEEPKITAERPPGAIIGVWGDVSFNTVSEARNLIQWMTAGCPRARAMYTFLVQLYGQNFAERCSDGIQYLLRMQNDAEKAWLYTTTGDSTPRSRRDGGQLQSRNRNDRRKKKKQLRLSVIGPSPRTVPDEDDPMPPAQGPSTSRDEQSYLGTSPPAPGANSADPGSSAASLSMALEELTRRAPRSWQGGARTINGDWPDSNTPVGTRMLPNDARVSRFLGFVAPTRRDGTSVHRIRFITEVLTAFSVMGLYERFAQRGEWEGAALPLEHYPFDCRNLTMSQALSWVHQHGIAPGSADAVILHSFARSWRNRHDRNNSPNGEEFAERPRNNIDVVNWPDAEITSWRHLVHGPLITGVTTEYPLQPARAAYDARIVAAAVAVAAPPAPEIVMDNVAPEVVATPVILSTIPEDTEMSLPEEGEVVDGNVNPAIEPANVPLPPD
ncbi:hypothetical protein C8R46DRAFT_1230231 [Mycena filopes]|nr:hypothetical protein C8R46DRAFT_1230231 [Mycena filopes]